jgi:hypothetical protein
VRGFGKLRKGLRVGMGSFWGVRKAMLLLKEREGGRVGFGGVARGWDGSYGDFGV